MSDQLEGRMREKAEKFLPCGSRYCAVIGEKLLHVSGCPGNHWPEVTQALLSVARERDEKFAVHTKAVGEFLNELYATMIDPLAEGEIKVQDMTEAILRQARKDREDLAELAQARAELMKVATALGQSAVAEAALRADLERAQQRIAMLEADNAAYMAAMKG